MFASKLTRKFVYGSQVNEIKLLSQVHDKDFLYLVSRHLDNLCVNSRAYSHMDVFKVYLEINPQ